MTNGRGIALHIGLNRVDPAAYQGWDGTLVACEADANDMYAITSKRGFTATKILTADATSGAVTGAIADAAGRLQSGDLFVLSYSGHGGQVPDPTNEEADHLDETWVLFDRQLIDDELYALWGRFKPAVRILVLSDSCHSGTVVRDLFYAASPANADASARFKYLPREVQQATYEAHRDLYDGLQAANPKGDRAALSAHLILISGCQDDQYSRDGDRNGLFTQRLREVWDGGAWDGGHPAFYRAIRGKMPPDQKPNYLRIGGTDSAFERSVPFTV